MAYRQVYLRIRTDCYSSGWTSDADRTAFKEESRRLFQELGWAVTFGHNGSCDTAVKNQQDDRLKIRSFLLAMMLCALCVTQASALEYTFDAPEDYLFGQPTEYENIDELNHLALCDRQRHLGSYPHARWNHLLHQPGADPHLEQLRFRQNGGNRRHFRGQRQGQLLGDVHLGHFLRKRQDDGECGGQDPGRDGLSRRVHAYAQLPVVGRYYGHQERHLEHCPGDYRHGSQPERDPDLQRQRADRSR